MIEEMRARVHLKFYGRNISSETTFYLSDFRTIFLIKTITWCTFNCSGINKSCPILNPFYFSFEVLVEGFVINYISVI